MFKKILIANRGEIACRIIYTAKKLGITTVAVYSEIDAHALHVKLADESYCIGKAPSQDSYLRGDKIIECAIQSNAQAIHPGYGFLSENADFADDCERAGICFIGPSATAIRAMGSKSNAKKIMQQAGIPLVPGYHGDNQDPQVLLQEANDIGYPILLKAAAGGGGKGMRIVHSPDQFISALQSAKREAMNSFGDDKMLLETYITEPRHVEVQIFADKFGNTVHLFERDCSIQRRHQKVIEEAPAINLSNTMRKDIAQAAINAAKAIDYANAGTIEFLVNGDQFYFMEMNTRLQVEHAVTEMVTDLDLVEWQLRIAAGEKLPLQQSEIQCKGHAIEARIYAEDPTNNFLPATGKIHHYKFPKGPNIRIDTGLQINSSISPYYDPMLAKLTVWGGTREQAVMQMQEALLQTHLVGLTTNLNFLYNIVSLLDFEIGKLNTHFIDNHLNELLLEKPIPINIYILATLYQLLMQQNNLQYYAENSSDNFSPWFANDTWRMNTSATERFLYQHSDKPLEVIVATGPTGFKIAVNNSSHPAKGSLKQNLLTAKIDNKSYSAQVYIHEENIHIIMDRSYVVKIWSPILQHKNTKETFSSIRAPMPGKIVAINVKTGDDFTKDSQLVVLEAMKMEHTIQAPINGKVKNCYFQEGDMVEEGQEILTIE